MIWRYENDSIEIAGDNFEKTEEGREAKRNFNWKRRKEKKQIFIDLVLQLTLLAQYNHDCINIKTGNHKENEVRNINIWILVLNVTFNLRENYC